MAVAATNLDSGSSNVAGTSVVTNSISPTSNNLLLLFVYLRNGASINPTVSSITGNGLTWVKINNSNYDNTSSSRRNIEVWRALGASPSAGAITINTTESETGFEWIVDQFSGIDTSGSNGSGAVVQSTTNVGGGGGALVVTLAAFSNANNAAYGAFSDDTGTDTTTAGSGFAKLGDVGSSDANINSRSTTEFENANDTTVDLTFGPSAVSSFGGIAIEIAAAAAGTAVKSQAMRGYSYPI